MSDLQDVGEGLSNLGKPVRRSARTPAKAPAKIPVAAAPPSSPLQEINDFLVGVRVITYGKEKSKRTEAMPRTVCGLSVGLGKPHDFGEAQHPTRTRCTTK